MHLNHKREIDGLRAVAILTVVVFHAFPRALPGGFVGVDVFFVISGFLITSIIARNLDDGEFGFWAFYARRIRRIFPALIIVLAATYWIGWHLLLAPDYMRLGKHIAFGSGFLSNFLLFGEVGYFDTASESKPLLHLWSLGIEEQFYILWPLIAYVAYRMRIKLFLVAGIIAAASFAANVIVIHHNAVAAFYLPVTRAWELMVGCILACVNVGGSNVKRNWRDEAFSVIGILLIGAAAIRLNKDDVFPGWLALLPTIGAAMIIHTGSRSWVNEKILSSRLFVAIGLISFPLYLWHWPILVFARVLASGEPSSLMRTTAVATSVLLACLTYWLVEIPIRNRPLKPALIVGLCTSLAICGYIGWNAYDRDGLQFRTIAKLNEQVTSQRRWDYWTDAACVKKYGTEPCQISSDHPDVMLWGDSHANHLYPGLANSGLKVIDVGTCWPLVDVLMGIEKNQSAWPCTNRDTFAFDWKVLRDNPSVKTVVIAGWWEPVLDGGLSDPQSREQWGGWQLIATRQDEARMDRSELLYRGMSRALDYLKSQSVRAIFVLDAPYVESDLGEFCRFGSRFGARSNCTIPRATFEARRAKEIAVVKRLEAAHPDLAVFDPLDYLCDADACYFVRDNELYYRDQNHLSVNGSKLLGRPLASLIANTKGKGPVQIQSASLAH